MNEIEKPVDLTCAECSSLLLLCTLRGIRKYPQNMRGCSEYDKCKRLFKQKYIEHLEKSKGTGSDLSTIALQFKSRRCGGLPALKPLADICVNDDWLIFNNAALTLQRLANQFRYAFWINVGMFINMAIYGVKGRTDRRNDAQELFLSWIRKSELLHKGELVLTMDGLMAKRGHRS